MKSHLPQALEDPSREIARLHNEILSAARTTLAHAIRIGQLLSEVKAELEHGEWLPWLERHVSFDRMTASRYMRVFERRDELKSNNVLHLAEAYRLLASPKLPPPLPPPAPKMSQKEINDLTAVVAFVCDKNGVDYTLNDIFAFQEGLRSGAYLTERA